jgi:hypothetical protein
MKHEHLFGWLKLDMALFVIANAILITLFSDTLATLRVGAIELIVLGLAVYRMANIVSNEPVTKPLRAPFVDEVPQDGKVVEKPKRTGFRGALGLLIYCPSCTGVWIAAALVYLYAFWPAQTFVVTLFLALSGIERIGTALVGWLKTPTPQEKRKEKEDRN